MSEIWRKVLASKTNAGVAAAALLKTVVEYDPSDAITWESKWVVLAGSFILWFTGVAIRHAIAKSSPN